MPLPRPATSPNLGSLGLPTTGGKRHLPQPRGPHSVGYVDVLTPGGADDGCLARIYYPTKEQCLSGHERWPVWKEDRYISGLFSFIQAMLSNWPSWAPISDYLGYDQLRYISPFLPNVGVPTMFRLLNGGPVYTPVLEGAVPDDTQRWPVAVFSHGLGCARMTYSRICYDLASYGFVVAATEHRDGTACCSFYKENDLVHYIPHRRVPSGPSEYGARNEQVRHRAREVSRTLDLLLQLNRGEKLANQMDPEGRFPLASWFSNRMNTDKPLLSGHSFGGCTTLLALADDPRFQIGIALDAWLFPIMKEQLSHKIRQPVLFISTDTFRHEDNLKKMREFSTCGSPPTPPTPPTSTPLQTERNGIGQENVDDPTSASANPERRFYYIKGSVHQNHIDTTFLLQNGPHLTKRVLGFASETCPEIVMDLNNKLMAQFAWKHLGQPEDKEIDEDIRKMRTLLGDLFPSG